ncbi:hypothetical protein NTGHW29_450022 [Candidatus Nitrotoga sp. HW29]|nr:hypothetical protein NTGHW29_450022 [Candidatus Nitrotoga sp. HW29]
MYSGTRKGLIRALKRGCFEPKEAMRNRRIMLVTAISVYSESELNYVHSWGEIFV